MFDELGEALANVVGVVLGVGDVEGEAEAAPEVFGEGDGLVVVEVDGVELADGEAVTAVDGETVGSGVTEGDGDADLVATGDGEVIGLGEEMPLFQTSFLPDLTQVNFLPL